jgi:4-hydroxy-3-methylbut-2-enyl diphosphate reductase
MKIELAKSMGFCFGVRRIVRMAEGLLAERGNVYCLGELIHNSQEVKRLAKLGMHFFKTPAELPSSKGDKVLISAHGAPSTVKEQIREKGYEVVDGTCPLVLLPGRLIKNLLGEGYQVVIMGDKNHSEIRSFVEEFKDESNRIDVISGPGDVPGLELAFSDKVGLICQTTSLYERFSEVVSEVLSRVSEVRAYNTICQATKKRQEATRELARRCDIVIVVGGHNSSNTNRLAEIASLYSECYHVESSDELEGGWFIGKRKLKVGIAAGASTPDYVICEVVEEIKRKVY